MKTAFLVPFLLFAPAASGARASPRKKTEKKIKKKIKTNIKKKIKKNTQKKKLAKHGGDGVRGRIVGGEPAPLDAYPWFVGLFDDSIGDVPFCGATLVSRQYALTAAECLLYFSLSTAKVGAYAAPYGDGRDDPAQNGGQAVQSLAVAEVVVHPGFNSSSMDFDFGLVKLAAPATAAPVPIDGRDGRDVVAGYGPGKTGLFVAGFGATDQDYYYTEEDYYYSDDLMQVDLNFVPQDVCQEELDEIIDGNIFDDDFSFDDDLFDDDFSFDDDLFDDDFSFDDDAFNMEFKVTDSMMCATDVGQGSCFGDEGGPLYDQDAETQVGVVSFGPSFNCTEVGVYSRISAAFPWIQETICAGTDDPDSEPFCQGYTSAPTPCVPSGRRAKKTKGSKSSDLCPKAGKGGKGEKGKTVKSAKA